VAPKDGHWPGFLIAPVVLNPAGSAVHAFSGRARDGPVGRGLADADSFCGLDGAAPLRPLSRVVASCGASHNEADSAHQYGAGGLVMVRKTWNHLALRLTRFARESFIRKPKWARLCFAWAVLALAVFGPLRLRAQAIIAPTGRTLFNRERLIRSFVEVRHLSVQAPDGTITDITQYITPLAFVYAFAPKWQVIAVQPYVTADMTLHSGNQSKTRDLNGFADSQFILQSDGLYSQNVPGGLTRLSGLFGVQAPTGAERFSTDAFAYTGGVVFEKVSRLRYALTTDFQYTVASDNKAGISQGNSASYDLAPAYFIIPREQAPASSSWLRRTFDRVFRNGAFAIVELNGTSQARAFAGGSGSVPNSGGTTLYVSPGIQYFVSRSFLAELSAPIPVVKDLNGTQPRPDSRLVLSFLWLF
jgi:hypothetical protein